MPEYGGVRMNDERLTALYEEAKRLNDEIDQHRHALSVLADIRRETLEQLIATGLTQAEIARRMGISRARISQMMKRPLKKAAPD